MAKSLERNRINQRAYYLRNPEYYRKKNARARQRKAEYIRQCKDVPCAECGTRYEHYQMEFDHIGPKLICVSSMTSASWKQIYEEIAKCEVVCANCHASRTWHRGVLVE